MSATKANNSGKYHPKIKEKNVTTNKDIGMMYLFCRTVFGKILRCVIKIQITKYNKMISFHSDSFGVSERPTEPFIASPKQPQSVTHCGCFISSTTNSPSDFETIFRSLFVFASSILILAICEFIAYVSRSTNFLSASQFAVCQVKNVKNNIISNKSHETVLIFPPINTNTPSTISAMQIITLNTNAQSIKNSNEKPGAPNHSLIRNASAPSSKYSSNL